MREDRPLRIMRAGRYRGVSRHPPRAMGCRFGKVESEQKPFDGDPYTRLAMGLNQAAPFIWTTSVFVSRHLDRDVLLTN